MNRVATFAAFAALNFFVLVAPLRATSIERYRLPYLSGDSTADGAITSFGLDTSINDSGTVAFIANFASGQAGYFGDQTSAAPIRITFGPTSSRTYSYPRINDSGTVVLQDRISPPLSFFVRTWSTALPGTFNVIERSGSGFDSVLLPSLANDGGVSLVGLAGSTSALYLNASGVEGASTPMAILTGGGARPMVADGGRAVVRKGSDAQPIVYYNGVIGNTLASSADGFTHTGAAPGITDDGKGVAFYGQDSLGPGIFVYDSESAPMPLRMLSVDPNATNLRDTLRGLTADTRVAVEKIPSFFDDQLRLVFSGTTDAGQTALFTARVGRTDHKVYGLTPIVTVGKAIDTGSDSVNAVNSFAIHDPLNKKGQIVFQFDSGVQGIGTFRAMNFTKYKQINDGTALNARLASTHWYDQPISPSNPNASTFSHAGCFLSSLATISGLFGHEMTPLEMRDELDVKGHLTASGGVNFNTLRTLVATPGKAVVVNPNRGGNYQDMVSQLRAGLPVLIGTPSSKMVTAGTFADFHAVVAYGLNPNLKPTDPVNPDDILISDPGYTNPYKTHYQTLYTPGEELLDVTLQDLFDRVSAGPFGFDAHTWFDNGTYTRDSDGQILSLDNNQRGRNMTFFSTTSAPPPQDSHLKIQSPVDLIITDPNTGKRYVSAQNLAQNGDLVLTKLFFESPGLTSEDDIVSSPIDPGAFPEYSLDLPPELKGHNLNVRLVGIGDGSYTVSLFTGSDALIPSTPLSGTITNGQIIEGTFTVVPEPTSSVVLLMIGMLIALKKIEASRSASPQRR